MDKRNRSNRIESRHLEVIALVALITAGAWLFYGGAGRLGGSEEHEILVLVVTLAACARLLLTSGRGIRHVRSHAEQREGSSFGEGLFFAVAIFHAIAFPLMLGGLILFLWVTAGPPPFSR